MSAFEGNADIGLGKMSASDQKRARAAVGDVHGAAVPC
jgi:hypothetical protein